ncbi:hypothetical protein AVEN_60060-1 [Araneus ventricosus]|uniref:Uncharacterized protein n=1 Tax=Araneus ventricosus TaxID=182803 RepID=A0A4Y2VYU1_ARAVE|nr:hypothetical protein AVEN_60060-1 [Araneus ventricosus]
MLVATMRGAGDPDNVLKPRTHDQINHRFRLRCTLLPAMGTGRFDVSRSLVRASVVSQLLAVNIKEARSDRRDPFPWPVVVCTVLAS